MPLRYPHIRLATYNRLLSSGDCVPAFAETARECGLSCPDDLSDVRRQVELGACGSLTMARKILEATVPACANKLYAQLTAKIDRHKLKLKKSHCRGLNKEPTVIDCGGMAPVVMDYLLQLLEGHAWESP